MEKTKYTVLITKEDVEFLPEEIKERVLVFNELLELETERHILWGMTPEDLTRADWEFLDMAHDRIDELRQLCEERHWEVPHRSMYVDF